IYFAMEALALGRDKFVEGFTKFGFEEEIPFSYPLRKSQISNDGKIASEGQLADTSFGQGQMLMNIVHLASSYGPIINDGKMVKPILFEDEQKGQVWKEGLISPENAAILRKDLREVVVSGSAKDANIPAIKISGKTGTAELKSSQSESGKENGFFV
ncbi:penicillin-binding transpeptidase domain-containing protein, partial [Microvirga sp. 3-52]|nr:penicillin-binding transpeptidase domain-containing protein [Microvirga sp. 3-52]